MHRSVRLVLLFRLHQTPAVQNSQGLLDGALGQTGVFGDLAVA